MAMMVMTIATWLEVPTITATTLHTGATKVHKTGFLA